MVILSEVVEASSSSSPPTYDHSYDVFLSFRGADTRLGFTNHLHAALKDASLVTFYDDEEIQTGESLKPELEKAIKASRASIVVLSENYASSTWCLEELVLILEQKRESNQIVIPIFFNVEPTDIRKQQGSFEKAMENHRLKMEAETSVEEKSVWAEKMERWRKALTEVSDLKGINARGRVERDVIGDIVNDLHSRFDVPSWTTTPPLFIGMEYEIKMITSWLTDGSSNTADILTIKGAGGIGKTSLANYVYTLHRSQFTCSSFVNNINRMHDEKLQGLLDIQKQLYGDISKQNTTRVHDVSRYTSMIEKTLALKKVLIVLDDINSLEQLDALLGNKGFHQGSKIIITTKDTSLTERCKLIKKQVQPKHTQILLGGLRASDSLRLLCNHAFKCHQPQKGYENVSGEIVKYCCGHPLALEILGSSLHKRDVPYWEYIIEELKKEPNLKVQKILQMSYDSLREKDKELFKYIACFFVGTDKDITQAILDACDIKTRFGIINLEERCLVSITSDNKLMMHSLIQVMGRDLVRQESPNKPGERSRLWCHEESIEVLKQSKGTENVLGLTLDMRMLEKDKLELKTDALRKMNNLKLLQLNYVKINGSCKNISKELRWLCMQGFHFESIPSDLPMENLVVLDMSHSKIESFDLSYSSSQRVTRKRKRKGMFESSSKYKPVFGSLKILDLSFSELLRSFEGFYHLPALEQLILANCTSLTTLGESIEHCVELLLIDLSNCRKLRKLPKSIRKLKKIKTFLANGCDLLVLPTELRGTDSAAIVEVIPRDLSSFVSSLPVSSLVKLSLENNNLSNESFPKSFSDLHMLQTLILNNNPIVSVPCCLRTLPRLWGLHMRDCGLLETIEHLPSSLGSLLLGSVGAVRKMKFNPKMLTLEISYMFEGPRGFLIDGSIEVEPLEHVEYEDIVGLEMCYGFGILSRYYEWGEMPNWISCRWEGSADQSISFTIPSSSNKLRGLSLCYVLEKSSNEVYFHLPPIIIDNITKNRDWTYHPIDLEVSPFEECCCLIYVSHWMFGINEMEEGDQITIFTGVDNIRECGIAFVYDLDEMIIEEEEDVLGYYKSWNHIIDGDVSTNFQIEPGYYDIHRRYFANDDTLTLARTSQSTYFRF